jgi:hypothetical protein
LNEERKIGKLPLTMIGIAVIGLGWVVAWVFKCLAPGIMGTVLTIVMLIQGYSQRPEKKEGG